MPRNRKADPDTIKTLEQRAAKAQRDLRYARAQQEKQARATRAHVGIVVGLDMIEHANRNPDSEVRRVAVHIVQNWLATRPKERAAFAPLLAQWGVTVPPLETAQPDQIEQAAE